MNKNHLLVWTLFAGLVLVVFSPALSAGFLVDDDALFLRNPMMDSWDGLLRIWTTAENADYWPLSYTSFWIVKQLFGNEPLPYHFLNLLLHASNAFLVYLVLKQLNAPGAVLAALLFALHPLVTESVAWAAELKNQLACLFLLLSTLQFVRFAFPPEEKKETGPKHTTRHYGLSLLFFILALLSKGSVAPLPAVFLLLLFWKNGSISWQNAKELAPFLLLAGFFSILTISMHDSRAGAMHVELPVTLGAKLALSIRIFWFYLAQIFWPSEFVFHYPKWGPQELDVAFALTFVLPLLLGAGMLLWKRNRWGKHVLLSLGCYAALLAPASGFFRIYYFHLSYVADRYAYFACIPILALVGAGLAQAAGFPKWKTIGIVSVVALLAFLGLRSNQECGKFRNLSTLWQDTLAKNPNSGMAYNGSAVHLTMTGKPQDALARYEKAIELMPDYVEARNNYATVLNILGRKQEAEQQWRLCLNQNPDLWLVHSSFAGFLLQEKRYAESIPHLEEALKGNPYSGQLDYSLGYALLQENRFESAVAPLQRAIDKKPNDLQAPVLLAKAWMELSNFEKAIPVLQKVLQRSQFDLESMELLCDGLEKSGRVEEAKLLAEKALETARFLNASEKAHVFEKRLQALSNK